MDIISCINKLFTRPLPRVVIATKNHSGIAALFTDKWCYAVIRDKKVKYIKREQMKKIFSKYQWVVNYRTYKDRESISSFIAIGKKSKQ